MCIIDSVLIFLLFSRMKKVVFFLMVLCASLPLEAYAASIDDYTSPAPYGVITTLSADTPEMGRSAVGFSIEQSGSPDYYRYAARLAYGVKDDLEFGVNVPYFHGTLSSFENFVFGAKHRVLDGRKHIFSGAYVLSMAVPVVSDLNTTNETITMGAIVSKRVGPVMGHLNASYTNELGDRYDDEQRAGAGFVFSAARGLQVIAEVYGMKSLASKGFDMKEARFAYRFVEDGGLFSTVGVGVGLNDTSSNYRFFASVSILFPRENVSRNVTGR
jgi:hypothetical protein